MGKYEDPKDVKRRRLMVTNSYTLVVALVVAAVLLLNVFTHVVQVVRYNGNGMEPNLHNGQTLLIRKTQNVVEGDIIVFYYNNQLLVRRVVCTGNKQLSIEEDGTLLVNGQVQVEDYLTEKSIGQCNLTFPYHVRSGYVFVMGDNRVTAMDSRLQEIGLVPLDRIVGKVILAI